MLKQFIVTCSMGKRLIGKGLAAHPEIRRVLSQGTLVIVAGTTNGYVAEEILASVNQADGFSRMGFRRGVTLPPAPPPINAPALAGDVVLFGGAWVRNKTIFDVIDDLKEGDVILKGANALNLQTAQAGVYIGHPKGGTIGVAVQAVIGRRVRMIVPVGLEKRVDADIATLALALNQPGVEGPRMMPLPGEAFTELDAIEQLTGAQATLLAAGGIYGAEGAVWIGVEGQDDQVEAAAQLIASVAGEPPCQA